MSAPELDRRLWFKHRGCTGLHFILGNPHTFPGRMLGWCEQKQRSFFFSKSEVEEASTEAYVWIDGFLCGNEPSAPINEDGDVDFESSEYQSWLNEMEHFRQTGALPIKGNNNA